ncbi:MAG: FhlB domain-containing protein [Deltaproteobacteria bacterium RIFOXYD12_FULL_50_9]|nr:MAG: FhlB domain-containing protein [Deltaproteobacteria bacterium RIFOXYD12_FULL_50_9]
MTEKDNSPKPTTLKKAVALHYDREQDAAPRVVGKGAGLLAEKILEIAREHNIPIHEDADLTELLSRLGLSQEIPPTAYLAVAEIMAFVYRANQNFAKGQK